MFPGWKTRRRSGIHNFGSLKIMAERRDGLCFITVRGVRSCKTLPYNGWEMLRYSNNSDGD
jgi:hypothetical protein